MHRDPPAPCPHILAPCENVTLPEDFQGLNHSSPNSTDLNIVVKRPILTKRKTMALRQTSNKHVSQILFNTLIKEGTKERDATSSSTENSEPQGHVANEECCRDLQVNAHRPILGPSPLHSPGLQSFTQRGQESFALSLVLYRLQSSTSKKLRDHEGGDDPVLNKIHRNTPPHPHLKSAIELG